MSELLFVYNYVVKEKKLKEKMRLKHRVLFGGFIFVYGDCVRVDKVERDGAQTMHVRSALVVANDISLGCLKFYQK